MSSDTTVKRNAGGFTSSSSQAFLDGTWRYSATPGFYDEVLTSSAIVAENGAENSASNGSQVREQWSALADALTEMGHAGLTRRWREGRRLIHDNGVTYNVYNDPQNTTRPWQLYPFRW